MGAQREKKGQKTRIMVLISTTRLSETAKKNGAFQCLFIMLEACLKTVLTTRRTPHTHIPHSGIEISAQSLTSYWGL